MRKIAVFNRFDSYPIDNSKYVYLYLTRECRESEVVFVLNDEFYEPFCDYESVLPFSKAERFLIDSELCFIDTWLPPDYLKFPYQEKEIFQLWHGIAIKDLSLVDKSFWIPRKSKYFLVPSDEVLDVFRGFEYEKLIIAGYPRNLALLEDNQEYLWGCDLNIWEKLQKVERGTKVILFMPTFRRNNFLSLDYITEDFLFKLERLGRKLDVVFILKFHPVQVLLSTHVSDFVSANKLERILIYEANRDIYPILNKVDLLITDYSSVVFDFLWTEKPFIFFIPDKTKVKQEFCFHELIWKIWQVTLTIETPEKLLYFIKNWVKGAVDFRFDFSLLYSLREKLFKNQSNCMNVIVREVL